MIRALETRKVKTPLTYTNTKKRAVVPTRRTAAHTMGICCEETFLQGRERDMIFHSLFPALSVFFLHPYFCRMSQEILSMRGCYIDVSAVCRQNEKSYIFFYFGAKCMICKHFFLTAVGLVRNPFPMATAGDSEELQLFRQTWKNELRKCRSDGTESNREKLRGCQHLETEALLRNKFRCFGEERRQLNVDLGDKVDSLECLNENSGSFWKSYHNTEEKSIPTSNQNETVLFVLPQPGEQSNSVSDCKRLKLQPDSTKNNKKSLVDQLIEDIDEITSIPFFDLSLPKEVGIQIFSHLEFKDLCACAQVSKSWKMLAEDELLWYRVGCKLGYGEENDCLTIDRTNWKTFVQHGMLKERDLKRNWKERICRLSGLEFERGEHLFHSKSRFFRVNIVSW